MQYTQQQTKDIKLKFLELISQGYQTENWEIVLGVK